MSTPAELQAQYYARTSDRYDAMHVDPDDEHHEALEHVIAYCAGLGYTSLLDVGAGTGRALLTLRDALPELELRGVEPVQALIDKAHASGVQPGVIAPGDGTRLPFADASFDVVTEFAVLHHVADPSAVVAEMTRVARRAVFLSDTNRFGWGPKPMRLVKYALWRAGVWKWADWLRNGGQAHRFTEDDGVFYSYSVYDSYRQLSEWADRIVLIPTRGADSRSWLHPLLTTRHILLCAFRRDG